MNKKHKIRVKNDDLIVDLERNIIYSEKKPSKKRNLSKDDIDHFRESFRFVKN